MMEFDKKRYDFFTAMYLECVCDTNRKGFLEDNSSRGLENYRKAIQDKPYEMLLDSFAGMMHAKMAIMFQEKHCRPLEETDSGSNINILKRSTESCSERIGILRSELLDFYLNHFTGNDSRPASKFLLDVKDTVRIVTVAKSQKDSMVYEYERTPCVITYIHLDYFDHLSLQDKHIYFAFFYEDVMKNAVPELLEHVRHFLAFRYDLKLRIEKDFNGNLYGKQMETAWSNSWLSIEKAGAHTDSSEISRLVKEVDFKNSNIMDTLFSLPESSLCGNITEEKQRIFRFIYNINISMYYRAVISEGETPFYAVDNIIEKPKDNKDRYFRIEDVLQFTQAGNPQLLYGTGAASDICVLKAINEAVLYGKKSKPQTDDKKCTGGIPKVKTITFRKKYLQAFLVDVLHNMKTYGKKDAPARIYMETKGVSPGYLVFCNEVAWTGEDGVAQWCANHNYQLKQSAEFDHAVDPNAPKGMSLACLAHCMKDFGKLVVRYKHIQEKVFFEIKLPIIHTEEEM